MKIKIFSIGKNKEDWLEKACNEYIKRLSGISSVDCIYVKNDAQLLSLTQKENLLIGLDPAGQIFTSEQFADFLQEKLQKGGARLSFVIGGPEGLPKTLKSECLVSLSPMTFTHQITRLILMEQLYRAFEIAKGSQYHK